MQNEKRWEKAKHWLKSQKVKYVKPIKEECRHFLQDESGMGVVEIILIIVVLISLVIIFKGQISTLVNNIMKSINKDAKSVYQ